MKISPWAYPLAKAEERAVGLAAERDKADRQLQDERTRFDIAS